MWQDYILTAYQAIASVQNNTNNQYLIILHVYVIIMTRPVEYFGTKAKWQLPVVDQQKLEKVKKKVFNLQFLMRSCSKSMQI